MLQRVGAWPATVEIAIGKARTAALFQRETALLEGASNVTDGKARTSLLSSGYLLMEGGVPIISDGQVVGAVGVSGVLPDQDAQVAKAAVAALA
jgi:glc operon protein GlcG